MHFNPAAPTVMHIDINSCFATIEQQANPFLRGKPLAIGAYTTNAGCILAASIEAKKVGVKTGMRVREAKLLCPGLIVLPSDPNKYRFVHKKLSAILKDYTNNFYPKSIDEFVLYLKGYPALANQTPWELGREIKSRIANEVGDWIRVSIGFGPNRFLAKTAAGFKKPDGLTIIDQGNFADIYERLSLVDLHGINVRNEARLHSVGIYSVPQFYNAELPQLRSAFHSVLAYYWYLRLRGWEIDNMEFARKSFGNQHALSKPYSEIDDLAPIMTKLVTKTASRLRKGGYIARGVSVYISYRRHHRNSPSWHKQLTLPHPIYATTDILRAALILLHQSPRKPVRVLSVSCFDIIKEQKLQLNIFENEGKKQNLFRKIDLINGRWGDYTISPASVLMAGGTVHDRIAFGGVTEL